MPPRTSQKHSYAPKEVRISYTAPIIHYVQPSLFLLASEMSE